MRLEQVKLFANGVKSVLKGQTANKPAVLQLFDKDGCMIAQRQILSRSNADGKYLEKLTVKADAASPQDGIDLVKSYKGVVWNNEKEVIRLYQDTAEFATPFKYMPDTAHSPMLPGLAWKEGAEQFCKGKTSSDKTLWKMLKQWCDFRRTDTLRETPKPMF